MPNFFGPSFRVEVNGTRLAADISKNIQQVSVVSKPGTLDTFSMSLANAYPRLRWTHTADAALFYEAKSVRIWMGYVDDLEKMFDGEITKITPTFPENGIPVLQVEGQTRLHWLKGGRKTRTFQDMTDTQIVQQIGSQVGLSVDAEDTGVQHAYVMQANETDLEFLSARARRIRFELLAEGTTLIFRRAKETEQRKYTLVWGNLQKGYTLTETMLPLKSFAPSMNTLNQVNRVRVQAYDPATKQEIVGEAGPGDKTSSMGGSKSGDEVTSAAFNRQREYVETNAPVRTEAEARQRAQAIYNERLMDFIQGSGATVGITGLRSGSVVELIGLGDRFTGSYYIEEATHAIGTSGYQTTFTAKRNSVK